MRNVKPFDRLVSDGRAGKHVLIRQAGQILSGCWSNAHHTSGQPGLGSDGDLGAPGGDGGVDTIGGVFS